VEVHAEGIGMLVTRLEAVLGIAPAPTPQAADSDAPPSGGDLGDTPVVPRHVAVPRDDALTASVTALAPAGAADAWLADVEHYLDAAGPAVAALAAQAAAAGSPAGAEVVGFLQQYLAEEDDLVPSRLGRYGLLDDAWLVLNTAFRLVESGLVPAAAVPVDWSRIVTADHVVRQLLPAEVLTTLEATVLHLLGMIASEVQAYQPWFTPGAHGYAPTMATPASAGGSWEDQMNERLLGTGLSVDG
jgi:hypothetical protein